MVDLLCVRDGLKEGGGEEEEEEKEEKLLGLVYRFYQFKQCCACVVVLCYLH